MGWPLLAQQFALELGFGVLLALAFVPPAPVGAFFYRLMGSCAALPLALVLFLRLRGGAGWGDPVALGSGLALLAFPAYGLVLGARVAGSARWWAGLALALAGCVLAASAVLRAAVPELSGAGLALGTLSSLATGAVAGGVGLAMVLGHWYLTVPKMEIRHLARLNRLTIAAMLASLATLAGACLFFAAELRAAEPPLFGPWGLFYLGTRLAVGLVLPLVFAAMAASALRFQNTRSATGILYASTVLVLIGAAVSVFLQGSYRVPL